MPLPPGTRLGAYEILASLGAGGMGEVYRAHDPRLGRDVAIKVLPHDLASSQDRLARFEREARVVARLNHPNIITLFSIEDADGTRFLTMELVDGQNLADLAPPGGMSLGQLLDVAIPLADALSTAHAEGIVHRDLKPSNVMVTRDGRVKVLDFGLAKMAQPTPDRPLHTSLSIVGEVLGTVPYMSPEQIFGEGVDARTDIFSLGIVLFEIATGRRPFAGDTFFEVTAAIMRDQPTSLTDVRHDLPAVLADIVGRCLRKQAAERFQSAAEVASELRALKRRLDSGESPPVAPLRSAVASIAVLPFVNRSASADDEYFSDGLADELLGLLAKINGLRVSARASSFQFKGKSVPLADVGRALNVATLLDGSVRRAGNRVRISVQLVRVTDGTPLWSESYDRTLEDILAVQDDIAHSVVQELRKTLLGEAADSGAVGRAKAEVDRAGKGRTRHPEAHRLHLLARHAMDQFSRDATAKAIAYLERAVEYDPGFALAWADLSVAYVRECSWESGSTTTGYEQARQAVERSLALEPDLADAHTQVAWLSMFHEWDWRRAESALARALELAPGNASVLRLSGVLAGVLGRPQDAIVVLRRALEQDPLSAAAYHSLGLALHSMDDFPGAEEAYGKALELAPQRMATHAHLSLVLLSQGRRDEALAEIPREPEPAYRHWATAIVHHVIGDESQSESALRMLTEEYAEGWSLQVAEVRAVRGEADAAFEWLDRAYAKRDTGLAHVQTNPRLRALHDDPRWGALLGRMGFAR